MRPGSLPHTTSCTWAALWLCLGPAWESPKTLKAAGHAPNSWSRAPPIREPKGPGWVMLGWQGWGSSSRQELGRKWDGSQVLDHLLSVPFQAQRKAASFRKLPQNLLSLSWGNPLGTCTVLRASQAGSQRMRERLVQGAQRASAGGKAHCLLKGRCGGRHRGRRVCFFFFRAEEGHRNRA